MKKSSLILSAAVGLILGVTGTFAATSLFKDVPTNHWAINAVNWAKENNLVEGYKDGTFGGNKNLSRYEMVQILLKYNLMNGETMAIMNKDIMDLKSEITALKKEMNVNDGIIDIEDQLTEAEIDLNGDGVMDKVKVTFEKGNYAYKSFTLNINGQEIVKDSDNAEGYFRIVDIDKNDKFKEIIISEDGPSNDYNSYFYTYDGAKIISMGEVPSAYKPYDEGKAQMNFPGNGTFTANIRGTVLQTWGYDAEYKLDQNHMIKEVPKDLYLMGTEVTMLKDLPLQTSRTDSKIITTLKTGEKATLVSSDDKQWVLAKSSKGIEGWFELSGPSGFTIKALNLDGTAVFSGLNMAD